MIRIYVIIAAIAAGFLVLGTIYQVGRSHGGDAVRAEIAKETRRRLNDATIADDVHNRCIADPACRLSDDGYKRK